MSIEAQARIVIKGDSESRRALAGVSRARTEAATAAKKASQEEQKANREAAKAQAASERAKRQEALATEKEAKRQAREQQRIADEQAAYWRKAAQRSADERIRAEQRITREAKREAARRLQQEKQTLEAQKKQNEEYARKGRAFLGGVIGAGLGGAFGAVRTARGVAGTRSIQERIQAANEFRERLTIAGSQAGLTKEERARVEGQINNAAVATGKDQNELVGVLESGQAKFNDLKFFADNLKEIATIARATGTDTQDLATSLGYVKQAFGLSGNEAMEAAKLMVAAASQGSIEVKDFAASFAPVAGIFAESTKVKGMAGVRQFLGVSQAAGTLGKSADETATLVERFVAALADPKTSKELKKGKNGGLSISGLNPEQVIAKLADSEKFNKPGAMQRVFTDVREQQAVTALMAAFRRARDDKTGKVVDIGRIANVQASSGTDLVTRTMADLEGSGALAFDRQNADLQANTLKNLNDWNGQLLKVNDVSMRLEKSLGSLSVWSDAIAASGVGGAIGGFAANGGGGGGGGGGFLSGLGEGVSKFGVPGAILGGGILAAGAVYKSGLGEWIGDTFANWTESDAVKRIKAGGGPVGDVKVQPSLPSNVVPMRAPQSASAPSADASQQKAAADQARVVKLLERQTQLQEQLVANGKPAPFRDVHGRSPR